MNKVTKTVVYDSALAEKIFNASKATMAELGYDVYKLRPIAYLAESRVDEGEGLVNVNMIFSPFTKEFSLVVKSETAAQESIEAISAKVFALFETKIK